MEGKKGSDDLDASIAYSRCGQTKFVQGGKNIEGKGHEEPFQVKWHHTGSDDDIFFSPG